MPNKHWSLTVRDVFNEQRLLRLRISVQTSLGGPTPNAVTVELRNATALNSPTTRLLRIGRVSSFEWQISMAPVQFPAKLRNCSFAAGR